ncbi:hypothetical protein B4U80_05633, partial [Leptotrombidium deliense]
KLKVELKRLETAGII